jgi:hypothetical protein
MWGAGPLKSSRPPAGAPGERATATARPSRLSRRGKRAPWTTCTKVEQPTPRAPACAASAAPTAGPVFSAILHFALTTTLESSFDRSHDLRPPGHPRSNPGRAREQPTSVRTNAGRFSIKSGLLRAPGALGGNVSHDCRRMILWCTPRQRVGARASLAWAMGLNGWRGLGVVLVSS